MANIWRRQPSGRIQLRDLVRDKTIDPAQLIAMKFFEAVDPPPPPGGTLKQMMMMGVGR